MYPKKRSTKLMILVAMSLSVIIIYKLMSKNSINYTSIGDGYALGINSYGQISYSYGDYVRDYLKQESQLNNYNNDFSSESLSIETLYYYILTNKEIKNNRKTINIKQLLRQTNILTISIGINDIKYQKAMESSISTEELNEKINTLITEIKKYYQGTIYIIGYNEKVVDSNIKKEISILNNLYINNPNICYISTNSLSKKYYLINTSQYPNYQGYKIISDKIISKIQKKLEK